MQTEQGGEEQIYLSDEAPDREWSSQIRAASSDSAQCSDSNASCPIGAGWDVDGVFAVRRRNDRRSTFSSFGDPASFERAVTEVALGSWCGGPIIINGHHGGQFQTPKILVLLHLSGPYSEYL